LLDDDSRRLSEHWRLLNAGVQMNQKDFWQVATGRKTAKIQEVQRQWQNTGWRTRCWWM